MIRTISPFDLVRLVFSGMGKLPNQAKPHRKLGSDRLSMLDVISPKPLLGLAPRRHTCVLTRGFKVKGLALAQDMGSPTVWEVSSLALSPDLGQSVMDLLNGLILNAGQRGVDRLFIRVADDSPCLDGVRAAGFTFYLRESLYRRDTRSGTEAAGSVTDAELQPVTQANEFSVFQLYNAVYPFHVREVEGQTLEHWRHTRAGNWRGRNSGQFFVVEKGLTVGWVGTRVQGRAGYFSIMIRPGASISPADILQLVEIRMADLETVFCMITEFETPLMQALEARGYTFVQEYSRAVRNVTAKIKRPSLVPIGAE